MALPQFEYDVEVIAKLDDEPNDVGGMTAEELKDSFDEASVAIKEYVNETLIPVLEEAGVEMISKNDDGSLPYIRLNANNLIETSQDGVSWYVTGSSGTININGVTEIEVEGVTTQPDDDGVLELSGYLALEDSTKAAVWGEDAPVRPKLNDVAAKMAQTVPAEMGSTGALLTAGEDGASWGVNPVHQELIGEVAVNVSGSLSWICSVPTGWSTEGVLGVVIEGDLTITGPHNLNEDSNKTSWLELGSYGERICTSYFPKEDNYDASETYPVKFKVVFWGVGSTGTTSKTVGMRTLDDSWSGYDYKQAMTLTVSDDIVTAVSQSLGFFYDSSYDYKPYADSCTGTIKFYTLKEAG